MLLEKPQLLLPIILVLGSRHDHLPCLSPGTFQVHQVHLQPADWSNLFPTQIHHGWDFYTGTSLLKTQDWVKQVRNYLNKQEEEAASGATRSPSSSCQEGSDSTVNRQSQRFNPKAAAWLRVWQGPEQALARLWQDSLAAERKEKHGQSWI